VKKRLPLASTGLFFYDPAPFASSLPDSQFLTLAVVRDPISAMVEAHVVDASNLDLRRCWLPRRGPDRGLHVALGCNRAA
jgi:hypothetical protein